MVVEKLKVELSAGADLELIICRNDRYSATTKFTKYMYSAPSRKKNQVLPFDEHILRRLQDYARFQETCTP
jgi:hypothetical protein